MGAQDKYIQLLKVINERKSWSLGEGSRIKALLAAGANPNVQNEYGRALLHWAINEGSLEAVKLLIENGADLNVQDQHGQTPLFFAQRYDYDEIATYLLEGGARVAQMTPHEQALWSAIRNKNYPEAEQLVTSGNININAVDNYGETLLHNAVRYGTSVIVALLLTEGANVNAKNHLGQTPLHLVAASHKSAASENINILMLNGANIEEKDVNGQTALCHAVSTDNFYTAQALIKHGADPDAFIVDSSGDKLTARAYVQKHWSGFSVRMLDEEEELYKASNGSAQTSAQLLGGSLSQVTNASSSSSVPQMEHRQAPTRR